MVLRLNNIKKICLNDRCFNVFCFFLNAYIICVTLTTTFVYSLSIVRWPFSIVKYLFIFFCLFKIIYYDLPEYHYTDVINIALLFGVLFISSCITTNRSLIQLFIIILATRKYQFSRIVSNVLKIQLFTTFVIVFLAVFNIIPNWHYGRTGLSNDVVRYCMGYKSSPYLAQLFFTFSMYFLTIKKEISFLDLIQLLFGNLLVFFITNTRGQLLFSYILLISSFIIKKSKFSKIDLLAFIAKILLIISPVIIFALTYYYDKNIPIMRWLNTGILSNRLLYGNMALTKYGIHLFGNYIKIVGTSEVITGSASARDVLVLDSSYIDLLLSNGILIFSIIMALYYKLINYAKKCKDVQLLIIIIVIILHSITDPQMVQIQFNLFPLLFSEIIFHTQKQKIDQKSNVEDINIELVHKVQTNMLSKICAYFEENNINYSLCGGTLLGAIRHKGFIPWDDDVDVLVPRDDYERLIELTRYNAFITNDICFATMQNTKSSLPFIKAYNYQYLVEEEFISVDGGEYLWIDIFPMDGLSENNKDNMKLYKKIKLLRNILSIRMANRDLLIKQCSSRIKMLIKPFIKLIIDFIPVKAISKRIDKASKKYSFDNSTFVGGVLWGYGPQERLRKSEVEKYVKVEFEGMKLKAFSCWDEYLTNLYGDYMKYPPIEARTTHLRRFEKLY